MAKTKKPEHPKYDWAVTANGQRTVIEAGFVEVVDGALILTDHRGGHLMRAFASGAWTTVEAVQTPIG